MALYQIIQRQKIPTSLAEVWNFISSPENLKDITPPQMDFIISSNNASEKMYAGMIITYKVSPLPGIKLNWITEITHLKEYEYFVDEQRMGPYKMWHHQHKIAAIAGGVFMSDIVSYQPPLGFLGAIANALFIKKKLKQIFDFRTIALEKRFGKFGLF
jgi:ligand-binding SRPBCC domain-containing protein